MYLAYRKKAESNTAASYIRQGGTSATSCKQIQIQEKAGSKTLRQHDFHFIIIHRYTKSKRHCIVLNNTDILIHVE
jgi:hypothetical protein